MEPDTDGATVFAYLDYSGMNPEGEIRCHACCESVAAEPLDPNSLGYVLTMDWRIWRCTGCKRSLLAVRDEACGLVHLPSYDATLATMLIDINVRAWFRFMFWLIEQRRTYGYHHAPLREFPNYEV